MKRVLVILPYVPYPLMRGTYQRVYHLTEELARHFEVDLFCLSSEPGDADHLARFEGFCRRVRFEPFQNVPWAPFLTDRLWHPLPVTVRHWWSEKVLQSLHEFTAGHSYDIIDFCDLVLWPYVKELFPDHPARVMDRSRVDWLYQTEVMQTLKHGWWERLKAAENLSKIARLEREVRRELALTVVCGPDDRSFLEGKLGPTEKIFVLANGANVEFFDATQWPPAATSEPSALFCGALDYTPNTDGLGWYFHEIHPLVMKARPDFRVILVGKNPTSEVRSYAKLPGVEFVGEVPDVRPYYQKAWMQIVPLRIGGGTRLKIAEGLAMANPVVSTTLGAQGLELDHDRHLLLADRPEDFAAAMLRYADEPQARQQHGSAGRAKILETYTWRALGKRLAGRLEALLS
ncbi:MAG: glycosyltransferase family 4 protein [Akkermansiaceae bacterium]|jgi:glycosyltransferase involved in cell wall biosynthesis|nr:glycosyltransferase family 4 protein [Akkermansiaceae bacterium]